LQIVLYLLKVFITPLTQVLMNAGCAVQQFLAVPLFAVQDTQGIAI
jgi:hypothetical protein